MPFRVNGMRKITGSTPSPSDGAPEADDGIGASGDVHPGGGAQPTADMEAEPEDGHVAAEPPFEVPDQGDVQGVARAKESGFDMQEPDGPGRDAKPAREIGCALALGGELRFQRIDVDGVRGDDRAPNLLGERPGEPLESPLSRSSRFPGLRHLQCARRLRRAPQAVERDRGVPEDGHGGREDDQRVAQTVQLPPELVGLGR